MIRARTATSTELPVSGLWLIAGDGAADDDVPVVTVTQPGGSTVTPDVDVDAGGCWRAEYVVAVTGRHVARAVTSGDGAVDFTAFVTGVVVAADMPTADDVDDYLNSFGTHTWDMVTLQDVLDSESAAQRRACDVPAAYPDDLREALLRRCWRNLAMRGQPLLTVPGADDAAASVVPGADQEVRRLERPFRKLRSR